MIAAELRGGNKPSLNEALGWIGSRVDDIYGANVGCLEDVWIDPGSGVPKWLLVKEGRFGGRSTLIPFEDATAGAGHVWVPYEREIVRDAPEIEPGAPLTHQVEASLRSHYAANAPAAISHRSQAVVQGDPLQPVSSPQAEEKQPREAPQPQRQVPREQPWLQPEPQRAPEPAPKPEAGLPPVQLPARPAPPIAAPGSYEQPPTRTASPPPPAQPPPAQYEPPPTYEQPPVRPGYEQYQPGQPAPAQDQQPPPPQPTVESLEPSAGASGMYDVVIELSGGLTIRGELRSLRIVPRG